MPIYEFLCSSCRSKSSFLVKSINQPFAPSCPTCGGKNLQRTISSFAYHKSLKTIQEESGEPATSLSSDYYKDPRNIGRWTEKKFQEMGIEMPSHLKEMVASTREGELPESMKDFKSATPDAAFS